MADIDGTSGQDILQGTADADHMTGGDGNDSLAGLGGDDELEGENGDDQLFGGDGNDQLVGGEGNDLMGGGLGDDVLLGGNGNDTLGIDYGQSDDYFGEGGDDRLLYYRDATAGATDALLAGGVGDDYLLAHFLPALAGLPGLLATMQGGDGFDHLESWGGTHIVIDAGGEADLVEIADYRTDYDITLGSGKDLLRIDSNQFLASQDTEIVVSDFTPGTLGDALDFIPYLARQLYNWNFADNPFATGHLHVEQRGADAVIQIDRNGSQPNLGFEDFIVLQNVDAAALRARNLGGYDPNGGATTGPVDGTVAPDFLNGTDGSNSINGFDGNDVLFGGAGDDELNGGAGDDKLDGELGNDTMHGGVGDDVLNDTIAGTDQLFGDEGNDALWVDRQFFAAPDTQFLLDGGSGNDQIRFMSGILKHDATLVGGAGDDQINAYLGRNVTIDAGEGNDYVDVDVGIGNAVITLGAGSDTLAPSMYLAPVVSFAVTDFQAGAGGDKFYLVPVLQRLVIGWDYLNPTNPFSDNFLRVARDGPDTLLLYNVDGEGTDYGVLGRLADVDAGQLTAFNFGYDVGAIVTLGTDGADTLLGSAAADELIGFGGDDTLFGGGGNDLLEGGNGDDILRGGSGSDTLDGGSGNDTADYAGAFGAVIVDLAAGGGLWNYAEGDVLSGIENITGTEWGDWLYGDSGANRLTGNGGDDHLSGRIGDDVLVGGAGDDVLAGGTGADSLDGGSGNDTADYAGAFGAVIVDLGAGGGLWNYAEGDVLSGIENITGTEWGDWLYGDGGANRLTGNGGDDHLSGRIGDDVLVGGAGDDVLAGGTGADSLDGGSGNDTADYAGAFGAVIVDLAAGGGLWNYAEGDGLSGIENITGTEWGDWLYGDGGANRLTGNGGDDHLSGRIGDDVLAGGAGDDVLIGGVGADSLDGGEGLDTADYSGNFGAVWVSLAAGQGFWNYAEGDSYSAIENVTGTSFNDLLEGTAGNNVLDGGSGADTLAGLAGSDTFAFSTALGGGNIDSITDMVAGVDKIALDNAIFAGFAEGALYSGAFHLGAAALDADDNVIYNPATGALLFDADGNGAGAAIQFASLQTGLALSAADIYVF